MPRDALVQTLGITFVVFTMALGTSLTLHGLMSTEIGIRSLAATLPALFGMALGEFLRHKLSEATFRTVFFCVLLVLGVWLAARPLFG